MKLCIVDGNYAVSRCVFGKAATLTSSSGEPTGGIYSFLRMIYTFKDHGDLVVVFDSGRSQMRKELYPEYKKRPKKESVSPGESDPVSDCFHYTFKYLEIMLPKMGIPVIRMNGQEADDVIYRLCQGLGAEGHVPIAVSDDKDYLQFCDKGFQVYQPMKDKWYDKEKFLEEMRFDVAYYVLVKALMGDSSDNIDGVPKIGPATSAKIVLALKEPTLEALHQWSMKEGKWNEVVRTHWPLIKRNYQLVNLDLCDVSVKDAMAAYSEAKEKAVIDLDTVIALFQKMEFKTLGNWIAELNQDVMRTG